MTNQPRGNHARVIYDDDIVGSKIVSEVSELRIRPVLVRAVDDEHPRRITLLERRLCYELNRKLVIKIRDMQPVFSIRVYPWLDVRNGRRPLVGRRRGGSNSTCSSTSARQQPRPPSHKSDRSESNAGSRRRCTSRVPTASRPEKHSAECLST